MRRAEFIIVGALLLVLVFGMALVGQEEALEAKLDSLDSTLHGIHYFVDPWGTERQWLPELFAFMETIEDDLDLFETKAVADLADLEIDVAAVEAKLDDETRWTDDAELATHEANVIAEIDANEVKIDILTVNLATHDTDIKADILQHDTDIKALIGSPAASISADIAAVKSDTAQLLTDVAAVKTDTETIISTIGSPAHATIAGDLASIEAKLDLETSFTDDDELNVHDSDIKTAIGNQTTALTGAMNAQTTALTGEINTNEGKIDTVISHVDGVEAKLDHSTYGLSALAVKLGTIDSKIGTIDTDIATIDTEVAAIEAKLDNPLWGLEAISTDLWYIYDDLWDDILGAGGIFDFLTNSGAVVLQDIEDDIATLESKLDALATLVLWLYSNAGGP
ncbi:hypothetical protein ACFLS5_01765 [Candidatus Bipolaricaulota bacterium]